MQVKCNVTMLKIKYTLKFEVKLSFAWSTGENSHLLKVRKTKGKINTGINTGILQITLILVFQYQLW